MIWAKAKINNNIRKAHFVLEGPSCMSALKNFSQRKFGCKKHMNNVNKRWLRTFVETVPYNQGTKIGVPKVFRRIPRNSSTNILEVPWNSDSYPPNTLAIRE
jgi:hypothetical protein